MFPEWAHALPAPPEPAEDATAARSRLFRALAELLGRLDTGLLVVEDAHWADEATLEFLLFPASRPPAADPAPGLLVTVRTEDIPAGSLLPRLARLAAGGRGLRLALGPLSQAGTAMLVASTLGAQQVTEHFAAFLHEQAGGVPLAVEESVRLLAARDDLTRRDGCWVRRRLPRLTVPPPIRDSVQERAARLTWDAQEVLSVTAVLAEPAREDVIAVVAGLEADRTRSAVAEALGCALLAEDERGMVSFRHALGFRAVYESIPGPARRLLHQRAGEALAQLDAPAATLARHFCEAGETQRWLHHAEQAADLALAAGDQAASAALLAGLVTGARLAAGEMARLMDKIVLLALPDETQLADLAAALREALGTSGLAPEAEACVRFQLGRLLWAMNESGASRAELQRAVTGLQPGSLQAARAMMLLGWPYGSDGSAREHLRWLRRAEVSAGDVPPLERLRLAIDRVGALLLLGEDAGWEQAAGIPWQPRTPGESLQVTRAHVNLGGAAMLWGRYAEARCSMEHSAELADLYGYTHLDEYAASNLLHLDWFTGAWPGLAERAAAVAADDGMRLAVRRNAALVSGLLAAASGDIQRAVELLEQSAAGGRQSGDLEELLEPSAALSRIHLAAGRFLRHNAGLSPLPLSIRSYVPFWKIRFFYGDGVGDVLGVAVAPFGGGPGGCPLASGPVARQPGDIVDEGADLDICGIGAESAVRAAGVGRDAVADEGERGGERDELRVGAGLHGGAGDRGGGHVVNEEQAPGFLPGEGGRLAAQLAAAAADGRLQVKERDFDLPSLSVQFSDFAGRELLVVQQRGQDPDPGGLGPAARGPGHDGEGDQAGDRVRQPRGGMVAGFPPAAGRHPGRLAHHDQLRPVGQHLQGLRGQALRVVLPAPDQVSAGPGCREVPFHRREAPVGEVHHPAPQGAEETVGELVLALVIGADLSGGPAAAGHADVPDDPQQRTARFRGGPEFAGQRVVTVQFQRGAVERGDLQAVPQRSQPELRAARLRADLEQAPHGVLPEPLPGLGQRAAGRDRPGPGPQARDPEGPGQHPVIALAGKQAADQHADQGHPRVERRVVPSRARLLLQRPSDRVLPEELREQAVPVQLIDPVRPERGTGRDPGGDLIRHRTGRQHGRGHDRIGSQQGSR
jgi:hypothetical protein